MSPRRPRFHLLRNLVTFVVGGGRWWLAPFLVLLILVSIVAAVGALAPYAAFVYPL